MRSTRNVSGWGKKGTKWLLVQYKTKLLFSKTHLSTHKVHTSLTFSCPLPDSDSPHSEPGTIDEADIGTETHTSDEGQCVQLSSYLLCEGPLFNTQRRCSGVGVLVRLPLTVFFFKSHHAEYHLLPFSVGYFWGSP